MVDLTGAFANVLHERFFHNLEKWLNELKIVNWISSYIRSTIIQTNECASDDIQISTRIPQRIAPINQFHTFSTTQTQSKYAVIPIAELQPKDFLMMCFCLQQA